MERSDGIRESSGRKKRKNRARRREIITISLIVAILVTVIGLYTISLRQSAGEWSGRLDTVNEQLAEEQERVKELEKEEIFMQSRDFIEKIARERLGLVDPDETVIKPGN